MNLVCIRHPKYKGINTPDLMCKQCCSIYVASIKQEQKLYAPKPFDAGAWLSGKSKEYYKERDATLEDEVK